MSVICGSQHWSLADPCHRAFFELVISVALTLGAVVSQIPALHPRWITAPFKQFLTLEEAEAMCIRGIHSSPQSSQSIRRRSPYKDAFVSSLALAETTSWVARGVFELQQNSSMRVNASIFSVVRSIPWLYCVFRPFAKPITTAPFDLWILVSAQTMFSIIEISMLVFYLFALSVPFPTVELFWIQLGQLILSILILIPIMDSPLALEPADGNDGVKRTPEDYTTLWKWITFAWIEPLIDEGSKKSLKEEDVYSLSLTIQSQPVFEQFNPIKSSSLFWRLFRANRADLILDFIGNTISVVFNYASPFFLNKILKTFGDPSPSARYHGLVYAALQALCLLVKAQADAQHLYFGRRAATRIRQELMASVYDKALKRRDLSGVASPPNDAASSSKGTSGFAKKSKPKVQKKNNGKKAEASANTGKIVNLMSADSNRIANFMSSAYFLYGAPFEITIACVFLYSLMGWAAFVGFSVLILASPLNHFLSKRSIRLGRAILAARDRRMEILNEIIGSIKFIKFLAWEERFMERVRDARNSELGILVRERINSILFSLLWSTSPVLVSVISFFTYTVVQGNELTPPVAFTAIALFLMLRMPLNVIPSWTVQGIQAAVALKRIEAFLSEEEVSNEVSGMKRSASANNGADGSIGIKNATFTWPTGQSSAAKADERSFELTDISVMFPSGQLSVITGPTASGKSALLLSLLGEMTMLPGGQLFIHKDPSRVDEYGFTSSISYCAQNPWLQHMSIRENILFGTPFDEERYTQVLDCCALNSDLAILEDGDQTEIGVRGVTLSGGQKARVALARAVYNHAKSVVLDDIFAAVDSHTAHVIWTKLFCGPLMKHRTVILVTHHLDLVHAGAHYLVRLIDGRIDLQGDINSLREKGLLRALIRMSPSARKQTTQPAKVAEAVDATQNTSNIRSLVGTTLPKKARQLVKDEERSKGSVRWIVYKTYVKACSYYVWGVLICLIAGKQILQIGERIWLREWGRAYGASMTSLSPLHAASIHLSPAEFPLFLHGAVLGVQQSIAPTLIAALPPATVNALPYVLIYASITLGASLVNTLGTCVVYFGSFRASRTLFSTVLLNVVQAPMRWFDTTPQGRILNRFASDFATVDSSISASIHTTMMWLAAFIGSVLTVVIFLPGFLPAALVIGFLYYRFSLGYVRTGRDLRRMESVSKSPIFASFGELLDGVVTVRAFSAEQAFFSVFHEKLDYTTSVWYLFWMLNRYLLLHFDFLSAASIFVTTVFALSGAVDSGTAGLTITSAGVFTSCAYWTCRQVTQLEMETNAVERIVDYLDLPNEPPPIIDGSRPPAAWPSSLSKDLVVVENLVVKYAPELDPVIKGLSFTLRARERVALVGRTGSGKSSLAMQLLRFVDPASGRILIDGVDITSIGVRDLRSRLTLIPQDAVLFSGTIQSNLDPFEEHSDDELWNVLERVHLISPEDRASLYTTNSSRAASPNTMLPDVNDGLGGVHQPEATTETENKRVITLETRVSAGGLNFSHGQRQLIAMARALLRQSAIVIMDEATSSMDFATDAKIQMVIREEFSNSLVICVAHRLRTVIDYDRIIVLEKGKIVEMDTPARLVEIEGGALREMCLKSGDFEQLRATALASVLQKT